MRLCFPLVNDRKVYAIRSCPLRPLDVNTTAIVQHICNIARAEWPRRRLNIHQPNNPSRCTVCVFAILYIIHRSYLPARCTHNLRISQEYSSLIRAGIYIQNALQHLQILIDVRMKANNHRHRVRDARTHHTRTHLTINDVARICEHISGHFTSTAGRRARVCWDCICI